MHAGRTACAMSKASLWRDGGQPGELQFQCLARCLSLRLSADGPAQEGRYVIAKTHRRPALIAGVTLPITLARLALARVLTRLGALPLGPARTGARPNRGCAEIGIVRRGVGP